MKKLFLLAISMSFFLYGQKDTHTLKVPNDKTINITINNNNNSPTNSTPSIEESKKNSGWVRTIDKNTRTSSPFFSSRVHNRDSFYMNLGSGSFVEENYSYRDSYTDSYTDSYGNPYTESGSSGHFSIGYSWGITRSVSLALETGSYAGIFGSNSAVSFSFSYLAIKPEFFFSPSFSIYAKLASPGDLKVESEDSYYEYNTVDLYFEIDSFIAIGASFWFTKSFGITLETLTLNYTNFDADLSITTFQLNFKQ